MSVCKSATLQPDRIEPWETVGQWLVRRREASSGCVDCGRARARAGTNRGLTVGLLQALVRADLLLRATQQELIRAAHIPPST